MKLAIFDLDNTLIDGDSDYLWGQFLVQKGIVEKDTYEKQNKRFYQEYLEGNLNIMEFLNFSLEPLSRQDYSLLDQLRTEYVQTIILPIIPQSARNLIKRHKEDECFTLIITATNRFITQPIAAELGVDELIATDPEFVHGQFTGQVSGIPCFREGKVDRLKAWLLRTGFNLANSWFYSDSHNDLPLLELVTHPIVVNPDDTLSQHAKSKGWPEIAIKNHN